MKSIKFYIEAHIIDDKGSPHEYGIFEVVGITTDKIYCERLNNKTLGFLWDARDNDLEHLFKIMPKFSIKKENYIFILRDKIGSRYRWGIRWGIKFEDVIQIWSEESKLDT